MITLEQIQTLENKIDKAVELISILKRENTVLKTTLDNSQERMKELEKLVDQFKSEQSEIEDGILSAISKLDNLEDNISETADAINEKSAQTEDIAQINNNGQKSRDEDQIETFEEPPSESTSTEAEEKEEDIIEIENNNSNTEQLENELDIF